jgi:hypothetical protein
MAAAIGSGGIAIASTITEGLDIRAFPAAASTAAPRDAVET